MKSNKIVFGALIAIVGGVTYKTIKNIKDKETDDEYRNQERTQN